jgi:hypothetical protein
VVAYGVWLATTYRRPADPSRVLPPFLLPIAAEMTHMGEEYLTDFPGEIRRPSRHSYRLRAHNVRQYPAGWFRDQTGLDNSTVLLPDETSEPRYRLVNHAAGTGSGTCCPPCCSSAASGAMSWSIFASMAWPPCRCWTGWPESEPAGNGCGASRARGRGRGRCR